jgi:hypothetical protein
MTKTVGVAQTRFESGARRLRLTFAAAAYNHCAPASSWIEQGSRDISLGAQLHASLHGG